MRYRIIVPSLGVTGGDVRPLAWLAEPGRFVKAGTPLFVVETDKANVEVEAFRSGYLAEVWAAPGDEIAVGSQVAVLADSVEEINYTDSVAVATESEVSGRAPSNVDDRGRSTSVLAFPFTPGVDGMAMYRSMMLIRRFEEHLYALFLQGLVPGTLHQYQGQEAVAVGVCSALRKDDVILSTHRPVGHLVAKGVSIRAIAAEMWGKATGCVGGKGGQMHLADASNGVFPSNAIVGANIPIATGAALGFKLAGSDRVAVSFFGDGAANIGAFHEGINLAAVKKAPVIFVCENNQYAASTHVSQNMLVGAIADRATAYGIPGATVDGMNVIAVMESTREAVARGRAAEGPTLLEFQTYRYAGHSRGDPGGYRTKEELAEWQARDPIPQLRNWLVHEQQVVPEEFDQCERECQQAVEDAVAFAIQSPEPSAESLMQHIFAD